MDDMLKKKISVSSRIQNPDNPAQILVALPAISSLTMYESPCNSMMPSCSFSAHQCSSPLPNMNIIFLP